MSKLIPRFFGKVVNGEVVYSRPELRKAYIATMEGERVEDVVQKEQKDKTEDQTGYFFAGVCGTVIEYKPGNTKVEVYEWLCGKVFSRHPQFFTGPDGQSIPKPYHISKMNREQLWWFTNECSMVIFEEWNIVVPEPTQVYWKQ